MSDYATIVKTSTFTRTKLLNGGLKPYWVTPSYDGKYCYISWSGTDSISRISYRTARIQKTTKVGDHPQRIRNGFIQKSYVAGLGFDQSSSPRRTSAPTIWERPTAKYLRRPLLSMDTFRLAEPAARPASRSGCAPRAPRPARP